MVAATFHTGVCVSCFSKVLYSQFCMRGTACPLSLLPLDNTTLFPASQCEDNSIPHRDVGMVELEAFHFVSSTAAASSATPPPPPKVRRFSHYLSSIRMQLGNAGQNYSLGILQPSLVLTRNAGPRTVHRSEKCKTSSTTDPRVAIPHRQTVGRPKRQKEGAEVCRFALGRVPSSFISDRGRKIGGWN